MHPAKFILNDLPPTIEKDLLNSNYFPYELSDIASYYCLLNQSTIQHLLLAIQDHHLISNLSTSDFPTILQETSISIEFLIFECSTPLILIIQLI